MSISYLPNSSQESLNTLATVKDLQSNNSDFEWYPTSDRIIQAVIDDVKRAGRAHTSKTVIDIGAGDGRVLTAFKQDSDLYICNLLGVEKSGNHVARWPSNITFVGGDFYESQVDTGNIDILFSNPPFGDLERWCEHLIKNVYATVCYLVLPKRWSNSERIQAAIKARGLRAKVILSDNFLDAERKARASVEVVRLISTSFDRRQYKIDKGFTLEGDEAEYSFNRYREQDPMNVWFEEMFPNISKLSSTGSSHVERSESSYSLFVKTNTIDDLVMLYQLAADAVLKNYKTLNSLDSALFYELNIDLKTIKNTLKARMKALRVEYWRAFIHNYKPITERLTAKYRNKIYDTLINRAEDISFNATNALIITQMVIKLANEYSEDQVKDFFYDLSNAKSVRLYKSNQKVFSRHNWRYCKNPDDRASHYALDYRIVQNRLFNISNRSCSDYLRNNEIVSVISDICIIARLIGMRVPSFVNGSEFDNGDIKTGDRLSINYHEGSNQINLFDLKFYKNGNQHLFLSQEFALRLNIFIGKVLGWVTCAEDAFDEMGSKSHNKEEFIKVFNETHFKPISFSDSALAGYLEAG